MPTIVPMRRLHFSVPRIEDVIAPPYDVVSPEERAALAARSPYNIVHIDLPEGDAKDKYPNAARRLAAWMQAGVLTQDATPSLLVYEQEFAPPDGGAPIRRRGFFALVLAEPYPTRQVLPHERTLSGPKEDRYRLFTATRTALSPVFLLYTDRSGEARGVIHGTELPHSFKTSDGITHRYQVITDRALIDTTTSALGREPLLIADGHHRYETTVSYAEAIDRERAEAGKAPNERGAHRYVLAFLADADDPGLVVFPTHRLIFGLPSFDGATLLSRATRFFEVLDVQGGVADVLRESGAVRPSIAAVFPGGEAKILRLRADADLESHPTLKKQPAILRGSDVVLLHAALLEDVLGITVEHQAAQTNIKYMKSTQVALQRIAAGEGNVLFLMNPTPVDVVRQICFAGEVMPQKSTYFYPKVPTGLALHVLDPDAVVGF